MDVWINERINEINESIIDKKWKYNKKNSRMKNSIGVCSIKFWMIKHRKMNKQVNARIQKNKSFKNNKFFLNFEIIVHIILAFVTTCEYIHVYVVVSAKNHFNYMAR